MRDVLNELTTAPERPLWTVRQLKLLIEIAELRHLDTIELSWERAKFPPCRCFCHEQSELLIKDKIPIHPQKCVCNGGTGFTEL